MNRIFKVLWNKSLKRFVVTNEMQRSRRKAKNETLAIGAALITLLPLSIDSVFASEITKASGWSNTTISTSGKVTNITTTKIQGDTANNKGIGINKFEKFTVTKGDIANLIVPKTANNLVNFVNDKISIDGTVNSLKESKVGGNLFFVTPSGMTVGETGVINAGSLTAVVTTDDAYKEWTGSLDKVNSALLNKMQTGAVPLNRTGVITVNGSINTGNRIVLAASQITIGSKAKLTNARALEEFKTLVNIDASRGVEAVSAGVDGTLEAKETTDGSGDILLLARTDTDAGSLSTNDYEASVEIKGTINSREDVVVGAIAGNGEYNPVTQQFSSSRLTGSLNSIATIRATVNVSGNVSADKDIDIAAKAINHVNKGGVVQTIKDLSTGAFGAFTGINEALDVGNLYTSANVTVQQTAAITSGGSLTVQAVSSTLLNLGAMFSPVQLFDLLKEEAEKVPAAAGVVALMDSSASVEIDGSLTSGGDLTIAASDTLKGTASAYAAEVAGVDDNPGHIAFTFAKFKGKSEVTVSDDAHLKLTKKTGSTSGGKVSITAKRTSRVDTSAEATVERGAYGAIAFNYTEHNTSSSVTMKTGIEGESAESLTIASENITERESMYAETSSGDIDGKTVKIHNILQGFTQNFVSGLMGQVAQGTDNSFTAQSFKLGGTVGVICGTQSSTVTIAPSTTFKSVGNVTIESLSKKIDHHYTVLAQSDGVKSKDGNQTGEVDTAGSIALLISLADDDDTVTSNLTIGNKSRIESTAGTLTINNKAEISYNRVKVMIEDLIQKAKELKEIYTYVNPDGKDWDAVDETIKAIEAQSEDEVTESFVKYTGTLGNRIKQAFWNSITFFKSCVTIYELVTSAGQFLQADSYVNSYVKASGSADEGKIAFGGAVGVLLQSTASDLTIGKNAILLSGAANSKTAGWISVNGESINESIAVSGHLDSFMGIPLPQSTDSDSFGASVLVQILDTDNKVTIREGAQLKDLSEIGAVKVVANDRIKNIAIGASADCSDGSIGVSANASVAKSTGVNRLRIDDEATITAGSITLQANRNDNNQAVVGTFSLGLGDDASKNVGASVAVNLIDFENTVAIEDNDVLEKDETSIVNDVYGLIEAKSTTSNSWGVDISARANTTLNSIGVSGGIASAGETTDPNIFQRTAGWFKDRKKSISDKIDSALDSIANKAPNGGNKVGSGIRNGVFKLFHINASGNKNLNNESGGDQPNVNEGNMQDENGNASLDEGNQSNDPSTSEQAKSFQIGLAASVAWNQVDLNNNVTIAADNLTIAAPKVNVEAVTNKWIGAWAGGVGISYVSQGEKGVSSAAGAGGAIAVNSGTLKNVVTISEGANKKGIFVGNATNNVESVTIRAVNDGTIIAEGLSAGVAASKSDQAGGQYSFDASVSVNMLENTVKTDVNHVTQSSAGTLSWDQAAWNGESQVTGGTGFGLSMQPNDEESSRSVGLLVAYAEINNTVQSSAKSVTLLNANKFDLRALTNLKQVTTAVGVNVTTGNSATSFTGSAGATNFINTVASEVSDSKITLSDGATTRILASGITKEDSEEFTKLAQWTPESKSAKDISTELNNADFYKEVVFQTEKEQTKENGQKLAELGSDKTGLHQTTVVVSTAVSVEKGSGAPAILVNQIDNNFTTSVESTTFTEIAGTKTGSYTQRAESNATSVAVATGIAASPSGKETFAIAGSLIVSNVDQKSKTTIKKSSITADTVAIESGNDATTVNVAGDVGLSLSEKGNAVGAAVLVMNTNNRAEITVENSSILNAATLTTKALNTARAWGVSVDVTASTQLAFGGSVAVNRVKNESVITVDGLTLKDNAAASFTADDTSNLWTLAGGVAYGGDTAGASGAVAYSISGRGKSDGTKVDVSNLTVQKTTGKTAGNLTVKAEGQDKVHTLVLAAGVSKDKVGFSGAAGVGEVKRTTTASVNNLKTELLNEAGTVITNTSMAVLGALSIKAIETAGVYNLGIAGAYGDSAGIGIGIAVNRISTTTNASLTRDADKVDSSRIRAQSLEVASKTSDDIENIAIGGAGSGKIAIMGSVVVNKLTDNTKAELSNVNVDIIGGAASVDAQSDDVIGSYAGGVSGAKEGAGGLSILVNDRFGDTQAVVSNSSVKQVEGSLTNNLKAKGSVDTSKINDKIVNDISVAASLENDREDLTIKGVRIGATSTATFKSFVINGAGAGDGAAVGCATVNYHGGSTKATLTNSEVEAVKDLTIETGDFVNVDNLLMVGAFAGKGAGTIAANVATTNHDTVTKVDGGSLTSKEGTVSVSSEAKEGVSSLGIALSGAQYGAGGVLVNVTRELSSAKTNLSETARTTITGKTVAATSDYLGRLNSLAIMASGAQYGSGVINVIVNYNDNDAITSLGKSKVTAEDSVTVTSLRRTENSGIGVQISGAEYGSLAATILVNTVEGDSKVTTDGAEIEVPILDSEAADGKTSPSITLSSAGEDIYDLVDVAITGAVYGSAGTLVVVNRFLATALTDVETSTIEGDSVTIEAKQNRDIDANTTFVSGSIGSLGANVLCTVVGSGNPFDKTETTPSKIDETINAYMGKYASVSSSDEPGILKEVQAGAGNTLTAEEKKDLLKVAAVSASTSSAEGGTHVKVNGSTIEADTVTIVAKEDTETWAQKTLKVGEYSGNLFGLAASVGTVREKRNLTTTISASTITVGETARIGTEIGGKTRLDAYQGKVAGIEGSTSFADIGIQGGSSVVLDQVTLDFDNDDMLDISARDNSDAQAYTFGIDVALLSGAMVVANIDDSSSVGIEVKNGSSIEGNAEIIASRSTVRHAEMRAGTGGALDFQWSSAAVTDTGNTTVTLSEVTASGTELNVLALNEANLYTKSYQGYASALNVGILESTTKAYGKTSLTVTSSNLNSSIVALNASSGAASYDADGNVNSGDALRLSAVVESYGASIIGGHVNNTALAENYTTTDLVVKDNLYGANTSLTLSEYGYAYYDVMSDLGTGGVLGEGCGVAKVNHSAKLTNTIASTAAGNDLGLFVLEVNNIEEGTLKAYAAGGTVIDMSAKAAKAEHNDISSVTSTLSGKWDAKDGILISNASAHKIDFLSDNTKGVVLGGSSAELDNLLAGDNTLTISGDWTSSLGSIYASAITYVDLGAVSGKTYAVDSAVYGVINGANATSKNILKRNTTVNIAKEATITAKNDLDIASQNVEDSTLRVRARTAGVAAGVTAYNNNTVTENTTINIAENAKLKNLDADYEVTLSASSSSKRVIDAIGDLQGAVVGGAGAESVNTITQTNEVKTAKGSTIEGAGNVNLYAGRDISGDEEDFDFTVYTHAYAKAIGGTSSKLEDTFDLTNRLTLSGDVNAVRSIEAVADIGTWSLNETSRYWELLSNKDAGSVRIASSAAGSKTGSGFSPVNSIVLDGKLTAGSQTKSVITITGLVDSSQSGYSIEGASTVTEPTITIDGAKGDISTGTESVANIYKKRYEELLKLISDYKGGDSQTTSTAVLAYSTEMELLRQKMVDQGLATFNDDKTIATITSEANRGYVKVSNVAVSGGNVNLRTDSVSGAGAITANAADKISIDNQSNLALAVENVRILEKGGNFTLNGVNQSSKPKGFTGTVKSASNTPDPSISIASKFLGTGGSVTVKETYVEGGVTQEKKKQITPDNTVTVSGVVANDAGNLAIDVSGDLFVAAGSRLAAAGAMKLSATRSVMQSYTSGIRNIGGDIEDLWADAVADYKKNKTSKAGLEVRVPTGGGIIAGSDIFVSADNININGTVQSGYASWTVDLTQTALEQKVSQIKDDWIKDGSKRDINPISNDYLISSGGHYKKSDGTYAMAVAVWYDPVNDRVIVDDINPQGGHIYLTGRIASTGGGKLYAASGVADVKIDSGTHSVRLGEITTKNGSGLIEITDTTDPGDGAMAKVYRWERYWVDDQVATKWSKGIVDKDGNHKTNTESILTGGVRDSFTFNPTQNLSYVWSEGYRTGSVSVATTSQKFKWWELMDSGDPSKWGNVNTTTVKDQALSKGITLQTNDIRSDNYKFNASTVEKQTSTGEWVTTTWTTYDNWTHWSGTYKSYAEKHDTGTKVYTYSVKADESVGVNFLTGTNTIDVTSGADIVLTGKLSAQEGTVNLTAQRNIINDDNDASIVGAKTLNLKAGAAIGEENSAIKIVDSKGEINLSAVASMENAIYLDATNTQEGAVINASGLTARDVILTSRGTVNVANLTAYEANLVSNAGDIVVSNLDQKNATDEIVRRFDATALNGSVTLSATGDIGIGKIIAGNAVTVTSTGGNVWDALYRDDLDDRNAEEKLRVWKEAGILSSDGANNGEARYNADVTAQEEIVKADFKRYEDYAALSEEKLAKLTDNQTKDFNSLKARFNGITSADAAVAAEKANANSNLAKTIAAKDNYGWSQTELLYSVSKAIVNPDSSSAPEAGDTNIEAKTISINVSQSAGIELNTQTFNFSEIDASTDKGMEAYKVLARADVDDVKWDKENESVTVTLKRPISIKLTGDAITSRLDGSAGTGFYAASDAKLFLGYINASDASVRLTSKLGIEALGEVNTNIDADKIVLRGGTGSLGTSEAPIKIKSSGAVSLSAEESIHIQELGGELRLVAAATEGELDLRTEKITPVQEDGQGSDGYIAAGTISLDGKDIGTSDNPLKIQVRENATTTLAVKQEKVGTFNLSVSGKGTLNLSLVNDRLETEGDLTLSALGSLLIDEELVSGNKLSLTADSMTIKESAILQANGIDLNALEGDINLTGATIKPLDGSQSSDVSILAKNGNVSINDVAFEDDVVALKVTTENGSVNLTSTDMTTPMKVKTLEIEAGKNINIAGNKIASAGELKFDAGSNINAKGSSLDSSGALSITASEWLFANDAHFTSTSSTVSLTSENDQIQAIGASIASNGSVQIRAKEGVDLQDASLTSENGSLIVDSESGTVDLSVLKTLNEIKANEIAISSKNVNLSRRTVTVTDALNVEATSSIDAPESTLVAKAGELNLKGDYTINLKLARLNSEKGSLTLTSSNSGIEAFHAKLESKGQMTIDAQGNADLTIATVTSKDSSILVNAKTAGLEAYYADFKAENGNLTIFAESDTNLKNARFKVSSTGLLSITTNSGDLDLSSSSTRDLYVNQLTVQSGSNVNLKSRDVITKGALLVKAAGSIEATYSLKSDSTIDLEGERGVFVNDSAVTSQEQLTITSKHGRIEAQGAMLKSAAKVNLTAGDIISANSVTVESPEALTVSANQGMNLDSANLTSNTDVTLNSTEGYVKATGLTLNTPTAFTVNAQYEVQLKDAKLSQMTGTIHLVSSKRDVGVAASSDEDAYILRAKNLIIEAGRDIDFRGRKAYLGEEPVTLRSRMLRATIPDGATGMILFESNESIYADGTTLTGSSIDLNSSAGDLFARKANFTSSGKFTLSAGSGIDVSETTLTANSTSEKLVLESDFGNVYAKDATLTSLVEIDVTANKDVSLSGVTSFTAPKVSLSSEFETVNLSGSVQITSPEISLTAETGDILLSDEAKLTATNGTVELNAGDDIFQSDDSVITASTLTATADDSIYLESNSGNRVPNVTLNSDYGSVGLNTAVDTTVNINNDRGHFVYGDVWLDAFNSSLILTDGVTSAKQVSVRAKRFETGYLVSDDGVYVSTNFNSDVAGTTSIKVDEIVSAEIGLMSENGSIQVENLNAFDGSVSVYRTSLETEGTITIGESKASSNGFIYNGNGNITSGLVSDEFVHLMIGRAGSANQLANTRGSSSSVMHKVSYLTKSINTMTRERANDYDWFPMMDWRKLGYTYVARATDVISADYHFAMAKLAKPFTREDDVIEDNWTISLESPEIEGLSVF